MQRRPSLPCLIVGVSTFTCSSWSCYDVNTLVHSAYCVTCFTICQRGKREHCAKPVNTVGGLFNRAAIVRGKRLPHPDAFNTAVGCAYFVVLLGGSVAKCSSIYSFVTNKKKGRMNI
jgi:hypothetical protein